MIRQFGKAIEPVKAWFNYDWGSVVGLAFTIFLVVLGVKGLYF